MSAATLRAAVPTALTLAAALALAACGRGFPRPEIPPFEPLDAPEPAEVEAVLFLVGDAGYTSDRRSPLLARLRADVERWSATLGRDSAVTVAYLGDNVYPDGVRDRSHPGFPTDSMRLWNQIDVLRGPASMRHGTAGWFLAGNHDWGGMIGEEGATRLRNQEELLDQARRDGIPVVMVPPAGAPGPVLREVGGFRIVFIDTHWFLAQPPEEEREAFFDALEDAFTTADDREVLVLSHHPWQTSGPHGVSEGGRALGYYWLLEKSGTLVQDLNSPAYGEFIASFRDRVRAAGRRALVFAAGHDHSLQVFTGLEDTDPVHGLVSGSGSKLSPVSDADGLRYAASRPGYMMLVFTKDGALELFVTAGTTPQACTARDEAARSSCMRNGIGAFRTVYSALLHESAASRRSAGG